MYNGQPNGMFQHLENKIHIETMNSYLPVFHSNNILFAVHSFEKKNQNFSLICNDYC